MRLRHQTLIVVLACLGSGGCARLLTALAAPQQAAMSTAGQVANRLTAPAQNELAGMHSEVDRLLAGKAANREELQRIKQELDRLNPANSPREGSAQDDPERLRPWHPRAPQPDPKAKSVTHIDAMVLGAVGGERGLPASGAVPDGVPRAELRAPIDLSRIRLKDR